MSQLGIQYKTEEGIVAGISTINNGFSQGDFRSMNLGLNTEDDSGLVAKNRALFFKAVAPNARIAFLNQTHSAVVLDADSVAFENGIDGDALFTFERDKVLSITVADCGNILLYEPQKFCAAIHAGWRGAHSGIVQNAVKAVEKKGADVSKMSAIVGPMICQENYEVGAEFKEYFQTKYLKLRGEKFLLDLKSFLIDELKSLGVCEIIDCAEDTYSNPEKYFSYRRSKQTGRMSAYISLL